MAWDCCIVDLDRHCAILAQPAFRLGTGTTLDQRADAHNLIKTVPVEQLCTYLLPRMYSLHNMPPEVMYS